jgi:hypothetical protein
MWEVGEYYISDSCDLTYPCKHYMTTLDESGVKIYSALDIFKKLQAKGLSHEHFEYCREIIRKRENPTPEDLAENPADKEEREKKIAEHEQIIKEYHIIQNTKASSRLEKLKAKNNICKF